MMPTGFTRRGFVLGSAGALLAGLRARTAFSAQALAVPQTTPGPRWLPPSEFVRGLPNLLDLANVPGVALALLNEGEVTFRGFGKAVVESGAGVGEDTVFEAASLGKPVFAYVVMRLVEARVLELDRPLYEYLPLPDGKDARMRRVTARHVLSHTTGLPNWRLEAAPLVPITDPGSTFSYSGEGFFYLQRVVERLTGVAVDRLMKEQVFDPFGMRRSSFTWLPEFEDRMAAGYDERGQRLDVYAAIGRRADVLAREWKKPLLDWRYEDSARAVPAIFAGRPVLPVYMTPSVAGSLLTTPADYARFLARVIAQPPAQGLDLRDDTLRQMYSSQVKLNRALGWGLGWGIQRDDFGTCLWHWGANTSFRNFVLADPASGRGVVVFTNSYNGAKIYQRVVMAVTGRDHPAFLWLYI